MGHNVTPALKKLKILEGLYHIAYEIKKNHLKRLHPHLDETTLHQKTTELIRKGCE